MIAALRAMKLTNDIAVRRTLRAAPAWRHRRVVVPTSARADRDIAARCDSGTGADAAEPVDFHACVATVGQLGGLRVPRNHPPSARADFAP